MTREQEEKRDRKMTEDGVAAQNYITRQYSVMANQCSASAVKMAFLNLLGEEHRIQQDLLSELYRRGWRRADMADREEIVQLQQWIREQEKAAKNI